MSEISKSIRVNDIQEYYKMANNIGRDQLELEDIIKILQEKRYDQCTPDMLYYIYGVLVGYVRKVEYHTRIQEVGSNKNTPHKIRKYEWGTSYIDLENKDDIILGKEEEAVVGGDLENIYLGTEELGLHTIPVEDYVQFFTAINKQGATDFSERTKGWEKARKVSCLRRKMLILNRVMYVYVGKYKASDLIRTFAEDVVNEMGFTKIHSKELVLRLVFATEFKRLKLTYLEDIKRRYEEVGM